MTPLLLSILTPVLAVFSDEDGPLDLSGRLERAILTGERDLFADALIEATKALPEPKKEAVFWELFLAMVNSPSLEVRKFLSYGLVAARFPVGIQETYLIGKKFAIVTSRQVGHQRGPEWFFAEIPWLIDTHEFSLDFPDPNHWLDHKPSSRLDLSVSPFMFKIRQWLWTFVYLGLSGGFDSVQIAYMFENLDEEGEGQEVGFKIEVRENYEPWDEMVRTVLVDVEPNFSAPGLLRLWTKQIEARFKKDAHVIGAIAIAAPLLAVFSDHEEDSLEDVVRRGFALNDVKLIESWFLSRQNDANYNEIFTLHDRMLEVLLSSFLDDVAASDTPLETCERWKATPLVSLQRHHVGQGILLRLLTERFWGATKDLNPLRAFSSLDELKDRLTMALKLTRGCGLAGLQLSPGLFGVFPVGLAYQPDDWQFLMGGDTWTWAQRLRSFPNMPSFGGRVPIFWVHKLTGLDPKVYESLRETDKSLVPLSWDPERILFLRFLPEDRSDPFWATALKIPELFIAPRSNFFFGR